MTGRSGVLLDTHVVLWWLIDDPTLADDVKTTIDDELEVYVSAATFWEIAIKQAKGKLGGPADLLERLAAADLPILAMSARHAMAAGRLPPLHHDPFDRMLVAQAQVDRLTLYTRDTRIPAYDVAVRAV